MYRIEGYLRANNKRRIFIIWTNKFGKFGPVTKPRAWLTPIATNLARHVIFASAAPIFPVKKYFHPPLPSPFPPSAMRYFINAPCILVSRFFLFFLFPRIIAKRSIIRYSNEREKKRRRKISLSFETSPSSTTARLRWISFPPRTVIPRTNEFVTLGGLGSGTRL